MNTTDEINTLGNELQQQGTGIVVTDAPSYAAAGEFLKSVKAYVKRVAETFTPMKRKALDAHKEIVAQERKHLAPAQAAEHAVKGTMLSWKRAEDARVAQARREAEEVARAEAQRQAEEEQLARAAAAEAEGNAEQADAILEAPAAPVMPVVAPPLPAAPAVAGISTRKRYTFEVVDADQVPREFMLVDTKKIGQLARMHKEQAKLAGVRFFIEETMSARS